MESEDNKKLVHEEEKYRYWLHEGALKQDKHVCFDLEDKLMQATMHGCTECLDKLIKAGADVNKTGKYKITALMWASKYGHLDCVKLLVAAGADLYMTDTFGKTALMNAIAGQNDGCTQTLLKAGPNLKVVHKYNQTALKYAASTVNRDCIKWLLDAGAEVEDDVTDMYINAVVELEHPVLAVEEVKIYRCIQLLLKVGGYINQSRGKNALETYIKNNKTSCGFIQMLLLAAGETVNDRIKTKMMKCCKNKFSLKHLSREAVRKQMIRARPHNNLIEAVPKLNIPAELESYLVYDVSLNHDDYSDFEFFLMWQTLQTDSEDEEDDEEDWDDDDDE